MFFSFIIFANFVVVQGLNSVWSWQNGDVPSPRNFTSYAPSACANGGNSHDKYSYACPHQALYSDDMLLAAEYDGLGNFLYALAGGRSDSDAGICYQVQLLDAERQWKPDFPMLVVQIINSGWDVMDGQLDVFMGAGGFGYFTALNVDCRTHYCNGGPCFEPMYKGDFEAWNNAQYNDPHLCYSGGVKWVDNANASLIWDLCSKLSGGESELKDRILWDSCARSNLELLHQNFYQTRYTRVQCPEGLYRVSGIRRLDDTNYVLPSLDRPLDRTCGGARERGRTCVSTMHDGCVPSASWPGKVTTFEGYTRVDRCDKNGNIM